MEATMHHGGWPATALNVAEDMTARMVDELSDLLCDRKGATGLVALCNDDDVAALAARNRTSEPVDQPGNVLVGFWHEHTRGASRHGGMQCDCAACSPITSTKNIIPVDSLVSRTMSMARTAVFTAVSKPMVSSVP